MTNYKHLPIMQGDQGILEVDNINDNEVTYAGGIKVKMTTEILPENGQLIVGHSETGHHHVIPNAGANIAQLFGTTDPTISVLRVKQATRMEHQRSYHAHGPIELLQKKDYVIIKQQEKRPEGWRTVLD